MFQNKELGWVQEAKSAHERGDALKEGRTAQIWAKWGMDWAAQSMVLLSYTFVAQSQSR